MSVPFEHSYIAMSEEVMSSFSQENERSNRGLNLKATELRLGLPGSESPERSIDGARVTKNLSVAGAKRGFFDALDKKHQLTVAVKEAVPHSPKPLMEKKPLAPANGHGFASSSKAQIVGWPPIRSFRKNTMATGPPKNSEDAESKSGCVYVKVSMDGAPYLRKVDLKVYGSYAELSSALEKMFSCFTIGQCGSNEIPVGGGLSESCLRDLLHGSENVLTYEDKDGDWMLVGDVPWDMFTDSCKRMRIMKSSEAIGLAPRAMEKCKNRNQ